MKSKKSKKLKSIRKASRDAFLDLHKKTGFPVSKSWGGKRENRSTQKSKYLKDLRNEEI